MRGSAMRTGAEFYRLRTTTRAVAIGLVLALMMAACAEGEPETEGESGADTAEDEAGEAATEEQVEELVIALAGLGNESMVPRLSPADNEPYMRLMYDPLIGVDRGSLEPSTETGILEDWYLSDDGMTMSLHVREGIEFHNGEEVTAEDVAFSIQRHFEDGSLTSYGPMITGFMDSDESVVIAGEYEVELNLNQHGYHMMAFMPWGSNEQLVVPKAYYEEVGEEEFNRNPIGTGPYRLLEHVQGSHVELEAVDDHFAVGTPQVPRITIRLVPEETTRVAMLRQGEVDVADVGVEQSADLTERGFNTFGKELLDKMTLYFVMHDEDNPLQDIRVREALAISINKEEIRDALFLGQGEVTNNYVVSAADGYKELPPSTFDLDRAQELLDDAGYGEGFSLSFQSFPKPGWPQRDVVEAIAVGWGAIGVDAEIEFRDYGSYRAEWAGQELPEPNAVLHVLPGTMVQLPTYRTWSIESRKLGDFDELNDLVHELADGTTDQEVAELEAAVDEYMVSNYLHVPILEMGPTMATNDKVQDWVLGNSLLGYNIRYLAWE